jgi:hypothetical protein
MDPIKRNSAQLVRLEAARLAQKAPSILRSQLEPLMVALDHWIVDVENRLDAFAGSPMINRGGLGAWIESVEARLKGLAGTAGGNSLLSWHSSNELERLAEWRAGVDARLDALAKLPNADTLRQLVYGGTADQITPRGQPASFESSTAAVDGHGDGTVQTNVPVLSVDESNRTPQNFPRDPADPSSA